MVATQIFLEFSPRKLGKMNPIWRAYFSDGWEKTTNQNSFYKFHQDIQMLQWQMHQVHTPASPAQPLPPGSGKYTTNNLHTSPYTPRFWYWPTNAYHENQAFIVET